MENFYEQVIDFGLKKGADEIELFIIEGFSEVVQIEKNAIKATENKTISGIGVRVYSNKRLGMATTSMLDRESINDIVLQAIKLSKFMPPDVLYKTLPGPFDSYPFVEGLCDEVICNFSDDQLTEMAIEAIDSSLEKQDVIVSGTFNRSFANELIYNSLGIAVSQNLSSLSGVLFAKAERNGDIATSWDFQKTRRKDQFDPVKIGGTAAENAVSLLGAKKVKTAKLPIILDHRSTLDTISSIVELGLNAYEVILGTAFFKDRLGEQIAYEHLTLFDNPLYPKGIGSAIFDDEGVPHTKLAIIENGIAKAYFSNSFCSNVLGINNTGNASRSSLNSKPHPGLSQIQIAPGDWSTTEIIAETKKGLYLKDSSLEPTTGSPNISGLVDQGFMIKNGEIVHPLKETMVGITVFELLESINAISKETLNESGSISPMIRIASAHIAGGE